LPCRIADQIIAPRVMTSAASVRRAVLSVRRSVGPSCSSTTWPAVSAGHGIDVRPHPHIGWPR
jgi:hypothetical protein